MGKSIATLKNGIIDVMPGLLGAITVLVLGLWIVKILLKIFSKALERSNIGPELSGFLSSMASITMKFIVVLIAAGILGFEISAIIGLPAGVVFAIGLALQGFLGNFASGITIFFFKPFKVGDWVQISDYFEKVESVQIFNTTSVTPGDKTLIIIGRPLVILIIESKRHLTKVELKWFIRKKLN